MAGIVQKSLSLIFIVVPQGMGGVLKENEKYQLAVIYNNELCVKK